MPEPEQGNVQPWRELVERVREALEYQERESMVGPLFPEALVDLDTLTTQIEERDDWKAIAEDSTLEAGKLIVKWKGRAEKAERALAEARKALGAYRGALLSGERETPKLAALADAALAASTEEPR